MSPRCIDIFCGAGGMALGFREAGFSHALALDNDTDSCATVEKNGVSPVVCADIRAVLFSHWKGRCDAVIGGFPCQSFSVMGKKDGLSDPRGSLVQEFSRAVLECFPPLFIAENVPGFLSTCGGEGYTALAAALGKKYNIEARVLDANEYGSPQKRKRVFIVGTKKGGTRVFRWPRPFSYRPVLSDAFSPGEKICTDGTYYSEKQKEVMGAVPEGGNWRDLPPHLRDSYLNPEIQKKGGSTGCARRLSWSKPCPTLTTWPKSKLSQKCHPSETRPISVRESARVQGFPDTWDFSGSVSSRYRQIGNAVPVQMARAMAAAAADYLSQQEA